MCPFWTKTAFFDRAIREGEQPIVKKYVAMYDVEDIVTRTWRDAKRGKDVCKYGFIARAQAGIVAAAEGMHRGDAGSINPRCISIIMRAYFFICTCPFTCCRKYYTKNGRAKQPRRKNFGKTGGTAAESTCVKEEYVLFY